MRHRVKMPNVGETTQAVVILEWLVPIGGVVTTEGPLLRVETDKVEVEVSSPVGGKLLECLAAINDEVSIGDPICVVES